MATPEERAWHRQQSLRMERIMDLQIALVRNETLVERWKHSHDASPWWRFIWRAYAKVEIRIHTAMITTIKAKLRALGEKV